MFKAVLFEKHPKNLAVCAWVSFRFHFRDHAIDAAFWGRAIKSCTIDSLLLSAALSCVVFYDVSTMQETDIPCVSPKQDTSNIYCHLQWLIFCTVWNEHITIKGGNWDWYLHWTGTFYIRSSGNSQRLSNKI
jgi:hypothetical protein